VAIMTDSLKSNATVKSLKLSGGVIKTGMIKSIKFKFMLYGNSTLNASPFDAYDNLFLSMKRPYILQTILMQAQLNLLK
jgi:hypothetical protein